MAQGSGVRGRNSIASLHYAWSSCRDRGGGLRLGLGEEQPGLTLE